MVRQGGLEARGPAVPDPDQDLLLGAQGERVGDVARRLPAAPGRQRQRVPDQECCQQAVVGDGGQPEKRVELGDGDQQGAGPDGGEQPGAGEEAADAV